MRENSIRFEFVVLRASDIAIQTPFGTPFLRVPGSRSRHLQPPRLAEERPEPHPARGRMQQLPDLMTTEAT